jgi:YHS domain-containing protein
VIRVLLIAVLMIVIANAFWRLVDGIIEAAGGTNREPRRRGGGSSSAVRLARDPVCGTHVPVNAALSLSTKGQTQYFCSEKCRDEYLKRN